MKVGLAILALLHSGVVLSGQTRTDLLAEQRAAKADDIREHRIAPEGSGTLERFMTFVEDGPILPWFNQDYAGWHPVIGDLATGSGLAAGMAYRYPFVKRDGYFGASANISTNVYRRVTAELFFSTFADLSVGVRARHRNYPQMLYFGLGDDTDAAGRSSYRLVDEGLQLEAHYRFRPWLRAGVSISAFDTELGPGTADDAPPTNDEYGESTAPGIDAQPRFLVSDLFIELDFRDVPANARDGGFYKGSFRNYDDLDLDRYAFRRFDLEATQLVPFFDKRRVLVVHGRMVHTAPRPGSEVPFYLMPYLGGDDTARGYREYRFHDRNLLVLNAEYRWEAFAGLDLALFFDAGNVASAASDFRLSKLKTSYGIGFRFSARNRFVFRLDIGTGGGEGTHVFVKFDHAF